jgi:DNA-binding NarL/FixJ family response regulator
VRILLADDHVILRQALKMLLNSRPGLEVVAETGNGRETVTVALETRPDVVLMDVNMPELNGY